MQLPSNRLYARNPCEFLLHGIFLGEVCQCDSLISLLRLSQFSKQLRTAHNIPPSKFTPHPSTWIASVKTRDSSRDSGSLRKVPWSNSSFLQCDKWVHHESVIHQLNGTPGFELVIYSKESILVYDQGYTSCTLWNTLDGFLPVGTFDFNKSWKVLFTLLCHYQPYRKQELTPHHFPFIFFFSFPIYELYLLQVSVPGLQVFFIRWYSFHNVCCSNSMPC